MCFRHRCWVKEMAYDDLVSSEEVCPEANSYSVYRDSLLAGDLGGRATMLHTVGGGLGLPSESSTLVLVRFAIWSRMIARSRRNFWIWRLSRESRSRYPSFSSSISLDRSLS